MAYRKALRLRDFPGVDRAVLLLKCKGAYVAVDTRTGRRILDTVRCSRDAAEHRLLSEIGWSLDIFGAVLRGLGEEMRQVPRKEEVR